MPSSTGPNAFVLPEGPYVWRPLLLDREKPQLFGWDVFALQTGLVWLGHVLSTWGADGYFGKETKRAVRNCQEDRGLKVDGIAGGATQRKIGTVIAEDVRVEYDLLEGIPFGHLERESNFILGNHSELRPPPDRTRDCGVAQRNTAETPMEHGFDTGESIMALGRRVSEHFNKYRHRVEERRAWELACGSWNAPAFTNWLAGIRDTSAVEPGPISRAKIEDYIAAVTAYVEW